MPVAELCESFDAAIKDPTNQALREFVLIQQQFMEDHAERKLDTEATPIIGSIRVTNLGRMMMSATAPSTEALDSANRKSILVATATTLNEIPGVSGRSIVRQNLRKLERFYTRVYNHSSNLSFIYGNGVLPITLETFGRAQDLRCWETGDLASKSLGQLASERFEIETMKAASTLGITSDLQNNLTAMLYEQAQRSAGLPSIPVSHT